MDGYRNINRFSVVPRQRGRGLGALAGTFARTVFRILPTYVLPVAKRLGKDVIESAVPELGDVIAEKTSLRKAAKRTAKKNNSQKTSRKTNEMNF